jgi:hypothetical protein
VIEAKSDVEFESPRLRQLGCWAAVRADGRLADRSDLLAGAAHSVLLDEDGAPTREGRGRVPELLADQPRYAKRIGGGRPGRPARPTPTRSCGAAASPGHASYGAASTGGSL